MRTCIVGESYSHGLCVFHRLEAHNNLPIKLRNMMKVKFGIVFSFVQLLLLNALYLLKNMHEDDEH